MLRTITNVLSHAGAGFIVILIIGSVGLVENAGANSGNKPQVVPPELLKDAPFDLRQQFEEKYELPNYVGKSAGLYSAADWQAAIDSTWGSGLSWDDKMLVWNDFWSYTDGYFACFNGLDSGLWDTIYAKYDSEIQDTVSRGRFSAIVQHAARALKESHTYCYDLGVRNTAAAPGVPIMYVGDWGNSTHFGAGLTPLADSSLLVYEAAESHPLGLEPGDRVLGYDGVAWKDLYPQLLEAELPLVWNSTGCSEASISHRMLMSAGRNWHLFDTIEVQKYSTGDTAHLPTSLMIGGTSGTYCTEQMDIPGVSKPDISSGQIVSWGLIDGTQIGYIYGQGWSWNAETEFYNAVDSLMNTHTTTGLIIDYRLNYGGDMALAHPGLELLFGDTVRSVRWNKRCNTSDRLAMCPDQDDDQASIFPDLATYYDKPIAVLTGPGAISSGDQIAQRMMYHPMAEFFGKPTDGAFNSPIPWTIHSDFSFAFAFWDASLLSNPGAYLTRTDFPSTADYPGVPFHEVWLTPDGVAAGQDDVVDSAVAWIERNCCIVRGDIDHSGSIDIADLVYLVDYMFNAGAAPPCIDEANIDGVGELDIADLVYMVDYMFSGGPAPVECP